MTIEKKNPDIAESREKHAKEHLAEMSDADLDKVAGGVRSAEECALERDSARKRVQEQHQYLQRILDHQQSLQESVVDKQGRINRNI